MEAMMRVELHDVPEDGPAADVHQRFRAEFGLFAEARPESAT